MDETIKRKTITIRKNFGLKLPDCIIAATAISLNMKFISADKQYRQMENLMFDFYQH